MKGKPGIALSMSCIDEHRFIFTLDRSGPMYTNVYFSVLFQNHPVARLKNSDWSLSSDLNN